jgi:acetoin utilization deacetylase AcuC-like enzyme
MGGTDDIASQPNGNGERRKAGPVSLTSLTVGISRDDRFLEHKTGHFHPEHPQRLTAIYRMLDQTFADRVKFFTPEPAALEWIEKVHTPAYIKRIMKTAEHRITSLAPDTPVSAGTYRAAWLAVGACLQGVDALLSDQCDAFFALVRPPGHHALADRAAGFCIFNNLAVAARYAMDQYGLERILIIDWDIHHGNGIHDIFYEDPRVFYLSTHDLMVYPYSGALEEIGRGKGMGYTMNIPLDRNATEKDILYLYAEVLSTIFKGFKPSMIMVAAGFDAHSDDPIGRSRWPTSVYAGITRLLCLLRRGLTTTPPLLLSLEGGYNPSALNASVKAVLSALIKDVESEVPEIPGHSPSPAMRELVEKIRMIHSPLGVIHD